MDAENPGTMGRSELAHERRSGTSEDRGRNDYDLEILYRDLGRRDRILLLAFVCVLGFPTHGVRVAVLVLLLMIELHFANRDAHAFSSTVVVKAWERRAMSALIVVLVFFKIMWWFTICVAAFALIRQGIVSYESQQMNTQPVSS